MSRPTFKRLFKTGCWMWLTLSILQMPCSGEKLRQPIRPHLLTVEHIPLKPEELAAAMISDSHVALTGGWELKSRDGKFGGLSAMKMIGHEHLFLSDSGVLVRVFGSVETETARALMAPLPGNCGDSWVDKEHDSESLAETPDGLQLRVGLETMNTLCRMDPAHMQQSRQIAIAAMQGWRANYGPEAMATIPGRGMAIIGEGSIDSKGSSPLLWYAGDAADPATPLIKMAYRPPAGFRPTDAAFLPDGRMIVINRQFSVFTGFASSLTLVPAFTPRAGLIVSGKELVRIEDADIADNYEGIAVQPHTGGATIWLVSDDNYFPLQRSLLLRLELNED